MRNRTENPVLDSENYTFVSTQTLRNIFPERMPAEQISQEHSVQANEADLRLTADVFMESLKRVPKSDD